MRCCECGREIYPEDEIITDGLWAICKPCALWFGRETATIMQSHLKKMDEVRQYCFAKYGIDDFCLEVDNEYGND